MLATHLAAVAALATTSISVASGQSHYTLHERRDTEASSPWVKREALDADVILPLRIGLMQSNLDKGYTWLIEVSDPDSPKYGQHYTSEEVHDMFAPSESSVSAVRTWLETAGIELDHVSQSVNKQWLQLDIPVSHAQALFQTRYHYYEDSNSGEHGIGCDEYHVPKHIQSHVDYITPGIKFFNPSRSPLSRIERPSVDSNKYGSFERSLSTAPRATPDANSNDLSNCSTLVTPACIRAMYNITPATSAQPGNELGIYEEGAYLSSSDLNSFFALYDQRIPNGTFPIFEGVDGAKNIDSAAMAAFETCVDFQASYPIIYPQKSILFLTNDHYYVFNSSKRGFLNNFLDAIDGSYCNYTAFGETGDSPQDPSYPDPHKGGYKGQLQCGVYKPPSVISMSYVPAELGYLPINYEQRQCNEYMKLGLQGVSIVTASGDFGVGVLPYKFHQAGLGYNACLGANTSIFATVFPASYPYLTTVGKTRLPPGASVSGDKERAATNFQSAGGFSNIFPRPRYQEAAVEAYFESPAAPTYPYYTGHTYGKGIYNRTGRGIPDVSANGQNMAAFCQGSKYMGDGTSISAPIFAGILIRINDERLKAGKSTVGFVNPTLYKNPHALHDITEGNNPNCNTTGFQAGPGWDPVTGLGTPNYPALLDVFMKCP